MGGSPGPRALTDHWVRCSVDVVRSLLPTFNFSKHSSSKLWVDTRTCMQRPFWTERHLMRPENMAFLWVHRNQMREPRSRPHQTCSGRNRVGRESPMRECLAAGIHDEPDCEEKMWLNHLHSVCANGHEDNVEDYFKPAISCKGYTRPQGRFKADQGSKG